MASSSPGARLWRTAFLTLRDETLASPEPAALLSLLRRLLLSHPSATLVSATSLLPPHEVTSDVIFLAESALAVSKCRDANDALFTICNLIHNIISKTRLEINSTYVIVMLNFLEGILEHLNGNSCRRGRDSSTRSTTVNTITDCLEILSFVVKCYERNSLVSESTQLIKVLLSIVSFLHVELLDVNKSREAGFTNLKYSNLWHMQTTTFSILGKVLARVGPALSADIWQSIVEVLRKVMDFLASNNLVLEDNVMARFYITFLNCLHSVLSDPKGSVSGHMAGFVATLQLFFMYGVSPATPTNKEPKESSSSPDSTLGLGLGLDREGASGAYIPPHLRRRGATKVNNNNGSSSNSSNNNSNNNNNNSSDSDSYIYDYSSSDSDLSDTDGYMKSGDRFRSSKARLAAICCVQDLCRADAKSLSSFWPLLLPENDVLQPRKNQATLMTSLIFDPVVKVRIEAVNTIGSMLEGQALVLSQVAEYKESVKLGSFTTLSTSLGKILMQLHTGILYLIQRENHTALVTGLFKLLVILISATSYTRMPDELLPGVISSVCNRISWNTTLKNEHFGLSVSVLSCLEMAFSKSLPSTDVLNLLVEEGNLGNQKESSVLVILFSCLERDVHPSIKFEALQVLRAISHNYPSTVHVTWSKVSASVHELLQTKCSDDSSFGSSRGETEKNAVPTIEKCVMAIVKVMDECLRAASGFQGADDRLEYRLMDIQQGSDQTRTKRVSSAPCFELGGLESVHPHHNPPVDTSSGLLMWHEAIEQHLPSALSHASPMVRAASVTCFAGLTSAVLFALTEEEKQFIISSSVAAATNDAIPSVRSAACRAIGVISSFPQVISNSRVLSEFINAVEFNTRNPLSSVRITASWALANICDSLRQKAAESNIEDEVAKSTVLLVESALRLTKDGDKIKSNAVRALGYLSRFIKFTDHSPTDNQLSPASGDSIWLQRMVQAFLSCVTTGNVKVQWNVCHALSNLFMNDTLKLQLMSWAPTVYHILLLLIRDSTNYKIRIHAAVALAVPASRIDYGSSFPDIVQGIVHVRESLSSSDDSSLPSSYKYRDNLEKQLAFTTLHLLGFVSSDDDQALKEFLVKKSMFLEDWLKVLCSSLKDECASSSDNNNSNKKEEESFTYVPNKSLITGALQSLLGVYRSCNQRTIAQRFEKLVSSLSC